MKDRKKILVSALAVALMVALLFAGCGKGGGGQGSAESALEGPTADILLATLNGTLDKLGEDDALPNTFNDPVTAENAPGLLGMLPDDFVSFVDEATAATAMINTFAFEVAVVKCKDAGDAAMVQEMIVKGFDSGKWICVFPEQSLAMASGPYVLLAVGKETQTVQIAASFKKLAGGVASEPEVFYAGETGGFAGEGGTAGEGGMSLDLGELDLTPR